MFAQRLDKMHAIMSQRGIDVMLLSVGADLPYFCGYEAMPLERLTMLVVPVDTQPCLVVPRLEAPRVQQRGDLFDVVAWDETDDPIAIVAERVGKCRHGAIGDQTWAGFLVDLVKSLPGVTWSRASEVTAPIRSVKEPREIERLREAGAAVDRIAARLQSGEIELVGRTEAQVSNEIGRQILEEGHDRVNFAIVAAGANAASPHHEPGSRVIRAGEVVLCDFGGTMIGSDGVGYCSDITRCVYTGQPPTEFSELYGVLFEAQAAAVASVEVGIAAQEVDRVARRIITGAGFGEHFVHRTGHGIGTEAHEDPYIVEGNVEPLVAGNAFSIEPGIYLGGRWGARIEDIVVASSTGADALNTVDHHLAVVA